MNSFGRCLLQSRV